MLCNLSCETSSVPYDVTHTRKCSCICTSMHGYTDHCKINSMSLELQTFIRIRLIPIGSSVPPDTSWNVTTVTDWLRARRGRGWSSGPGRVKNFHLVAQTGSGAQTISYPTGTWGSFPGGNEVGA
jgi:hypothetical protein